MITTDGYNNIDHYADGYMEQEEEWEREGLLDPAWEKQQKKVSETEKCIFVKPMDTVSKWLALTSLALRNLKYAFYLVVLPVRPLPASKQYTIPV